MTAGVIANAQKDADGSYTNEICEFLSAKHVHYSINDLEAPADFWVVLGGDGTMLRASHTAAIRGIPMLGINIGTLGYLTDADSRDGTDAIARVINGNYVKESRLMLEAGAEGDIRERVALNDAYLSRGSGRLTTFSLYINGRLMDNLRADGVIVSTPTGSTAYNLSAGGPILMPDGDMMVVTAVCPHTLHVRPWVISAKDEVLIVPASGEVVCSLDGEDRGTLHPGVGITVRRSEYRAEIIKTSSPHFYEVLREKLTDNTMRQP